MSETGLKVVLLGDAAVGKTSLFHALPQAGLYEEGYKPTVGAAFQNIRLPRPNGGEVAISCWDTAGQDDYRGIVPLYLTNAVVVMVCYDVTRKETFDSIPHWVDLVKSSRAADGIQTIVVGCKADLPNHAVTLEQMDDMYSTCGCTSSRWPESVATWCDAPRTHKHMTTSHTILETASAFTPTDTESRESVRS
jgi:small GTP-binding protein